MILAENGANLNFNEKCIDVDFTKNKVTFENTLTKNIKGLIQILSLVRTAFSNVRKKMVDKYNHHYEYNEIDHDYKELLIPY